MEKPTDRTVVFQASEVQKQGALEILKLVYRALEEKGYDPYNQLVGYLLSGDPAYITSHNDARNVIRRMERDELLEILLRSYLSQ